jgi:hypothetical protein
MVNKKFFFKQFTINLVVKLLNEPFLKYTLPSVLRVRGITSKNDAYAHIFCGTTQNKLVSWISNFL